MIARRLAETVVEVRRIQCADHADMRDTQRRRPQLQNAIARAIEEAAELDQDINAVVIDTLSRLPVSERRERNEMVAAGNDVAAHRAAVVCADAIGADRKALAIVLGKDVS